MSITLEEILVRIRADTGGSERAILAVDRAARTLGAAGTEAGRVYGRGMREVASASERAARDVMRSGERAARGAVAAARSSTAEQIRLSRSLAREREADARRVSASLRREAAVQRQIASGIGMGMTMAGGLIVAGLAASVATAVKFETAFTGVRKTVDLTDAEFAKLEKTLRRMATTEIPLKLEDLAGIAEAGGQLGIAGKDLENFTRITAQMAASTNLSMEAAAEGMARISTVMGLTSRDFQALGSTIVDLGNKSNATEEDIVQIGMRLAGAAKNANLTTRDMLAFASSIRSVGVEAESGGTSFSRVIKNINTAAMSGGKELANFAQVAGVSAAQFQTLFKADAGRAIALFVEGLGQLRKEGVNLVPVLSGLGFVNSRIQDTLLRLAGAQGTVTQALADARPAWQEATALGDEAGKRFKTTASQITLTTNEIKEIGSEIGETLLPAFRDGLIVFRDWLKAFQGLSPEAQSTATKVALIGGAALVVGGQVARLIVTISELRTALLGVGTAGLIASGKGGLGALGASISGLLPLIAEAAPFIGAAVGGGLLGKKLADIQTERQGLVSLSEAERSNRAQDALAEFQKREPSLNGRPRRVAPEGSVFSNLLEGSRGLQALRPQPQVNLNLSPEASRSLALIDRALSSVGTQGVITSGFRPGQQRSFHNLGREGGAVDLAFPGRNHAQIAAMINALGLPGVRAAAERKGQINPNGSVSTGEHVHVTLARAIVEAGKQIAGRGGLGISGARPSAPHFETKEEKAARAAAEREAKQAAAERARNQAEFRKRLASEEAQARGDELQAFLIQHREPGVNDQQLIRLFRVQESQKTDRERAQEAETREQNRASFRTARRAEQARMRGDTEGAFVIENRQPGITDRQIRESFNEQQTRIAKEAREANEKQQREAIANVMIGFGGERKVQDLREQNRFQDADFQAFLNANQDVNSALAATPGLLDTVRDAFNRDWLDKNRIDETNDGMRELQQELRSLTQEANRAAKGTPLTDDESFARFARENKTIQDAFARGDFLAVGKARELFGTKEDAIRGKEKADILREINDELIQQRRLMRATPEEAFAIGLERKDQAGQVIRPDQDEVQRIFRERRLIEREKITAQSRAELDQRRRGIRGNEFDRFAISREQIDEHGRVNQPFGKAELREQFKLIQQMDLMEQSIGSVRDIFLRAFTDMGTGAKGFFSSLISGFQQTLTRMTAEFLSSQVASFFTSMLGGLIGGGGATAPSGGGTGFMIPHRAMGGPLFAGQAAWVGERGPELFVPRQSGRIEPSGSSGRGPVTVHMTVHTPDANSFRQAQGAMVMDMQRRLERSQRDR